ncbi:MAG: hypothetical protein K2K55_00520 [Duncaniella sp.]|nr:hypothetical protein [Duncaniella sp.]
MNQRTTEFFLTASEVNAQLRMPLSSLVAAIIESATGHANVIGVGYNDMMKTNSSWVLSRLAIDIAEMPRLNGTYELTTWITGINRLFSDRCFAIVDKADGRTVVAAHSVWMAIDMDTRRPADLTALNRMTDRISDRPAPCDAPGVIRPFSCAEADCSYDYTVGVSDIDVNRHLTTRRYIDLIVDLQDLGFYDGHRLTRFEIAFKKETRYDEKVVVARRTTSPEGEEDEYVAMIAADDAPHTLARLRFEKENIN